MSTPQVKEVNSETGKETLRDMNAAELAELAQSQQERQDQEAAAAQEAANKASAEAKLAALGLTADDLKALGL